ncbi:MAG: glycerophosphodiester phosphodiesterase [Anaerolineae bacterium]
MIEHEVVGTGRVVLVGHRGARAYAPENTVASFEKAAAMGVHCFECDVRLTRDGEVIVLHDSRIDRVSNGHGAAADMTLAELRALNFAVHFPEYGPQPIPTLVEALDAAKRLGIEIVVEIKGEPEPSRDLVKRTVAQVRQAGMVDKCAIISFYWPCLSWVREQEDGLDTGILFDRDTPDPVGEARTYSANSVRPYQGLVTAKMAEEVHAAGLCLHTWNSNDADLTRRLVAMGVDSIGSDNPDIVRQTLVEMGRLA